MKIFGAQFNHRKIYIFSLILVAISLPLSKVAVSISMIVLSCNWLLELDFKRKRRMFRSNRAILIFFGVYLVHLLWLFNTENFQYAIHDLLNKAILLVYPIIIGTSARISSTQIKIILVWFSLAVLSSTLISTFILLQWIDYPVQNIRDISPFISHIRLSLLINLSIFSLGYILFSRRFKKSRIEQVVYTLIGIWLVVFLYLLQSLTGILIFGILVFLILAWLSTKIKDLVLRLFLQVFLVTIFLLTASVITHAISRFYTKELVDFENLKELTINGNRYRHYTNRDQIENGHYVWIYICEKEMQQEWNERSTYLYNGKGENKQSIKQTLIRYLTSKGLKKDSVGISKLTAQDIQNIEQGLANHIYENKYAIYPKLYNIIWQIDVYRKGYNPAGNSITLRVEFLKTALKIIKENFWSGVGTGDVQDAFDQQYKEDQSKLPQKYWLRAHNQYITFFLSFGLLGFLLVWCVVFYPVYQLKGFRNYFFTIFFLISMLSFIHEDTLETHIGVTFFSYFYSLFLFGAGKDNLKEEENDKEI